MVVRRPRRAIRLFPLIARRSPLRGNEGGRHLSCRNQCCPIRLRPTAGEGGHDVGPRETGRSQAGLILIRFSFRHSILDAYGHFFVLSFLQSCYNLVQFSLRKNWESVLAPNHSTAEN